MTGDVPMHADREPSDRLWRASTWRNVLIALAVSVVIAVVFEVWAGEAGVPRTLRIGAPVRLSAESLAARLDSIQASESARNYVLWSTVSLDLLFPIAYSLLFSFAIGAALRSLGRPRLHPLRFLPFAAALADYAENAVIVRFAAGGTSQEAAKLLVMLTPAKWWLIGASFAVAAAVGLWAFVRRRRRS